jgi:nitroreductase
MSEISLNDAIFSTRAMRHFKSEPVPKEDLEYLIEAATMAPSAGNLQMWAFVIVTDLEKRRQLANAHREVGNAYIRDTILADPLTDDDRRRVYTNAMHNVEHLDEAPAIIVACLTQPSPDDARVASGFFGSIFPAIQNILLGARSRGLGSVLITLASDYSPIAPIENQSVRDILNLPENINSVALIPVGYPQGQWGRPRRQPWQDCIHWEGWT